MGFKRTSKAVWKGPGLEGTGALTTPSGLLTNQPYSVKLRFQNEDGKAGTNPEELVAAAHAGCYAMALSVALTAAGFAPTELVVNATLQMEKDTGWFVKDIVLDLDGRVPNIGREKFMELAETAKKNCPISRALASVPITLHANLL